MVDDDLFVRRNCKPDVDAKAGAVMVLFTGRDHRDAASDNSAIAFLQPFDFTFDCRAHRLRWLASFESQLQWHLHN